MFRFRYFLSPFTILLVLLLLAGTAFIAKQSPYSTHLAIASPPPTMSGGSTNSIDRQRPGRNEQLYSSDYEWLTDQETTRFGESIWFFGGDSFFHPIRTNHNIAIHPGAYFGSRVVVGGNLLGWAGPVSPNIIIHAAVTPFPTQATSLRNYAGDRGRWLVTSDQTYTYGIWFHGITGEIWQWHTGTRSPYLDGNSNHFPFSWAFDSPFAIFCDGDLRICGSVHGIVGVGAAGNIRIMDNIVYSQGEPPYYRVTSDMTDRLTLVSEAAMPTDTEAQPTGILIANTWANGRDNSVRGSNIAINAHLIALNSSFTFEQQNDVWDPYIAPDTLSRDERGYIYLTGSVMQRQRGYVHRANHGGSGYLKSYEYDPRFSSTPAPFAIPVAPEHYTLQGHP